MLSMPPATITSASPSWMAWAASTTAFSPEPQALFTVKLGTSFGTPPSSAATRPGLRPSPAGSTWPRITSSTCAGSRRARRMASRTTTPPSLVAGVCARAPPRVPMAVRVALTITGVGMRAPPSGRRNVAPRATSRHPLDSDSCATETGGRNGHLRAHHVGRRGAGRGPDAVGLASPDPGASPEEGRPHGPEKPRDWAWADLMRRVFDLDVLACPRCGGRMTLIATIEARDVNRTILGHLGLPTEPPAPLLPRSPPRALDLFPANLA